MNDPKQARKRLERWGLGLGLACLGLLAGRLLRHEPTYEGTTASGWVQKALRGDHSPKTLEALSAMGPSTVE